MAVLRIRDVYSGFWFLSIPDPRFWFYFIPKLGSNSNKKEEGGQKLVVFLYFVAINFTKLENILFLWTGAEKILANWQRIKVFFPENLNLALSNMGWGSGVRKNTYLGSGSRGSKKAPDPGSVTLVHKVHFYSCMPVKNHPWVFCKLNFHWHYPIVMCRNCFDF